MRIFSFLTSTVLIACLSIQGQPLSEKLTLKQAWQYTLQNNLSLKQQQVLIARAAEHLATQKALRGAEVSLKASYAYISELARLELPFSLPGVMLPEIEAGVKNQYDAALNVTQPLFTGFRIRNSIQSAMALQEAEEINKEVVRNKVLLSVGQLYYQLQLNLLQQQTVQQAIARADLHLKKAQSFYNSGQSIALDTLEVANRKLALADQLQQLQNTETILFSRLKMLMNYEGNYAVGLDTTKFQPAALQPLEYYLAISAENRPELRHLVKLRDAQRYRMGVAKADLFPQLFLSGAYHYARPGVNFFKDEWMTYYTIGVSLQWKLWDWKRTRHVIRKAKLDQERLDVQTQQLLQEVNQEVTEAYHQLQSLRQQIEVQRKLVEQERLRYRQVGDRYQQGLATSLDLSDAEKSFFAAQLRFHQSLMRWKENDLKLKYAMGIIGK